MKATLYKLKEGYVLCSDEQPNHDYKGLMLFTPAMRLLNDMGVSLMGDFKKVLTQSPDFSLLSEQDAKRIGWFDVDRMANTDCNELTYNDYKHLCIRGYKVGFKKALSLTSDKRFTEEDMIKAFNDGMKNAWKTISEKILPEEYTKPLSQPKSWEVEYKEENGVYKVTKIL